MGAFDGEGADVLAIAAGVAVERAAHRARDPGRELQARQLLVPTPADELEKIGPAADVGRCAIELDGLDRVADHEAAKAIIRHQEVAAAAEQEHRQARRMGRGQRAHQLLLGARGEVEVRRPADAERRVVAERLLRQQPVAEGVAEAIFDRALGAGHSSLARSRKAWPRSNTTGPSRWADVKGEGAQAARTRFPFPPARTL